MKTTIFFALGCAVSVHLSLLRAEDADHFHSVSEEDRVVLHQGDVSFHVSEKKVGLGGFLFPEMIVTATGGVFEPGSTAEDLATTEHDPQNDVGIQGIELHVGIDLGESITGGIAVFGHLGADRVWDAKFEGVYLHYNIGENIAIGGGQFLNAFGFESDQHLHSWNFVNRNLVNSRILNEGEMITQGAEVLISIPEISGLLTIGTGGVRTHEHAHEELAEQDAEHHLDADEANFENAIVSADFQFRPTVEGDSRFSISLAGGENGLGSDTFVYGAGFEKTLEDFIFRVEWMGRSIEGVDEEGEALNFSDTGVSATVIHLISDRSTLSIRHDWVSDIAELELDDRHRISPAFTTFLGKSERVRARVQYDYTQSDAIGTEHAAWLQFQVQWGGDGGGRHHHHDH